MHRLSEEVIKERIAAIADFYADPFETRTVNEFCVTLGLGRDGYYSFYKSNREEIEFLAEKRRKKYNFELKNAALKSLTRRMKSSDKALQMALEISGAYVPKTESTQTIRNETEQKAYVEAMLERLKKKQKPSNQASGAEIAPEEKS